MAINKQRPKLRPFFFLGIFLVAWLLLPLSWKIGVRSSFDEFHAPIWEASSRVRDLSDYWGHISDSKNTLIEKGRDHSRILADVKLQLNRKKDLKRELENLRKINEEISTLEKSLNLQPALNFIPQIARVSYRNISTWSQNLIINKGKNYNIRKGDGVISSIGVIGRINKVESRSATLQLLTNREFRTVAHLKGDKRPITFTGAGISNGRQNFGTVTDVPQDVIIPPEGYLEVVSSSLGGAIPDGLEIGKIYDLEPSVDGLFQSAKVIINERLNLIKEVTILAKLDE